jgi:hypothetical protein
MIINIEHKSTLFRGSESSAKLISAISNVLGKDFLIQSLSYPLQKLQEMLDQELFFEVNPMNCDPSILPQNIENLKKICGVFLDSVISSAEFLPQYVYSYYVDFKTIIFKNIYCGQIITNLIFS